MHIVLQTGALNKMISLQTLIISTFVGLRDFNIPSVIADLHTLRNLNLKVCIYYTYYILHPLQLYNIYKYYVYI